MHQKQPKSKHLHSHEQYQNVNLLRPESNQEDTSQNKEFVVDKSAQHIGSGARTKYAERWNGYGSSNRTVEPRE